MKKSLIIFLLLIIPIATAQPDLILQHQEFYQGETLIAEITATNIIESITLNNIEFYQGNKQVFFEHDLFFNNNTYFFYMYLTKQGNFTIKISDILYKSPEPQQTTIEKNIEIKSPENQTQILSIKPGFIFSITPPEITLSNKGTQTLAITYDSQEISIPSGSFKKIQLTPLKTFDYLTISTYKEFKVPVIYMPLTTNASQLKTKLKPSPSFLKLNLISKNKTTQTIELINFAKTPITDISITSPLNFIEFEKPESIPAKSIYNLTLNFNPKEESSHKEDLTISFTQTQANISEQKSIIIPLEIHIFPEDTNIEELTNQTCTEINGIFCTEENTDCEGDIKVTFDGLCCIGTCEKTDTDDEGGGYGWLIGIGLLLLIAVIIFFVYKRLNKTQPIPAEEQIMEKSKLYEQRVSGSLSKE